MSFRWGRIPPEHIILVCPHKASVSGCPLCRRAALFCSCASWQPISCPPCRPVAFKASCGGGRPLPKQGVKREAACLGSWGQQKWEPHPGCCHPNPAGLLCSSWSTWFGICFSGSWGQWQHENRPVHYLFIYLCSLNFSAGGLHPLHALRLHKYLLWETVGGVAQCEEYEAGMEWRAKAV